MQGLDFDDVLIEPIPSEVNSRSEVDISVKLSKNLVLNFPLIVSPMRGIIDADFAIEISKLGGIGIIHRFYDTDDEWFSEITKLKHGYQKFGIAIPLNYKNYDEILFAYHPNILVVDVANGYTDALLKFCEQIKDSIIRNSYNTLLMSGNVATPKGLENLRDSGVDIVRYGIGGGGLCTTRNVTGIGYASLSALINASNIDGVKICADGGIRNSGDFVKAIVAGADFAMAGSLFGQTFESPNNELIYGMASRKLNEMQYTQVKSVEGIEKAINKKWPLSQFVDEFSWGIKSAGTYLNARNLDEIRANGKFVPTGTGSIKRL